MAANHKSAHISNVRERRAKRLEEELKNPPVDDVAAEEAMEDEYFQEAEDEAVAQSEAERSDSAEAESVGRPQKEKPMTFGSVDG